MPTENQPCRAQRRTPTHFRRSVTVAVIPSLVLAFVSCLPAGSIGDWLSLLWIAALAMGAFLVLRQPGTGVGMSAILSATALLLGLLGVSAVWAVSSVLAVDTNEWIIRPVVTAGALIVASGLRCLAIAGATGIPHSYAASAAIPAVALPVLFAVGLVRWGGGSGAILSSLQAEDASAWVSQALGATRAGHLPLSGTESEYFFYPMTSTTVGVVARVALWGAPDPGASATSALESVALSWLLAGLTLGLTCLAVTVLFLSNVRTSRRATMAAVLIGSTVVQGSVWVLIGALTGPQQLSLAWAGTATCATALLMFAGGYDRQKSPALAVSVLLVGIAAGGAWPFGIIGIAAAVAFTSAMLVERIGRDSTGVIVAAWLGLGLGLSELIDYVRVYRATPESLLSGEGGYLEVSGLTLLALACCIVVVAASPIRRWPVKVFAGTSGGLALGAITVWLVASSSYAPGKATYLFLLSLPLGLAAAIGWAATVAPRTVRWLALASSVALLVAAPLTHDVIERVRELESGQGAGIGPRMLEVAQLSGDRGRIICTPSPEITSYENYACQRWMDAFSSVQPGGELRDLWLATSIDSPSAADESIRRARARDLVGTDPFYVSALWVLRGAGEGPLTPGTPATTG